VEIKKELHELNKLSPC